MKVEQIAIFLENKSGRLSEITGVLADNNINIRSLSLADTADFGILRLIVDKVSEAEKVLKEGGFTVGKTHVIAVEVPDRVGGLASVLKVIEIMSSSDESWADAARKGVKKASDTVKGMRSAWVQDQSVTVKDGEVDKFRVTLKVTFEVK